MENSSDPEMRNAGVLDSTSEQGFVEISGGNRFLQSFSLEEHLKDSRLCGSRSFQLRTSAYSHVSVMRHLQLNLTLSQGETCLDVLSRCLAVHVQQVRRLTFNITCYRSLSHHVLVGSGNLTAKLTHTEPYDWKTTNQTGLPLGFAFGFVCGTTLRLAS